MDTLKSVVGGPATATEYFTLNFLELGASILLMFIFASFLMFIIKFISTKKCTKVVPNSKTNETITVMESKLLDGWWFMLSIVVFLASIFVVRGAFGAGVIPYFTNREGLITTIEIFISFGVLAATVPKFGVVFAEKMAYNLVRSQVEKKTDVITVTPDEYMKLGTPEPKP